MFVPDYKQNNKATWHCTNARNTTSPSNLMQRCMYWLL